MSRFFAQSVEPGQRVRQPRSMRANAGIRAAYHEAMLREIAAMRRDVTATILREYSGNYPRLAQDAAPLEGLKRAFSRLMDKWQTRFDAFADVAARGFVRQASGSATRGVSAALKEIGFTVKFQNTTTVSEAIKGCLAENVELIKSIPSECLLEVQQMVESSARAGRDLGALKADIKSRFDVADSRAALIARDQNNKVTANVTRARQQDLGISEGRWRHSGFSTAPRPSHVAADGVRFDLKKGLFLDEKWVLPGEAINCGCTWTMIIPGYNDE